jgi:hypothetical protein
MNNIGPAALPGLAATASVRRPPGAALAVSATSELPFAQSLHQLESDFLPGCLCQPIQIAQEASEDATGKLLPDSANVHGLPMGLRHTGYAANSYATSGSDGTAGSGPPAVISGDQFGTSTSDSAMRADEPFAGQRGGDIAIGSTNESSSSSNVARFALMSGAVESPAVAARIDSIGQAALLAPPVQSRSIQQSADIELTAKADNAHETDGVAYPTSPHTAIAMQPRGLPPLAVTVAHSPLGVELAVRVTIENASAGVNLLRLISRELFRAGIVSARVVLNGKATQHSQENSPYSQTGAPHGPWSR